MYKTAIDYVLMFFFFSAAGWTGECTYRSLGERRVINTGFLYGPICPIYGTGAMVFEVLLVPLSQPVNKRWWVVLLVGVVAADIVEYLTSLGMEKLFHARWWDYSEEFLNINGRICFKHTCYWAVFSILYVYFISPTYRYIVSFIPDTLRPALVGVILALFGVDLVFTVIAAVDIGKFMQKLDALRLNVSTAAETVKEHAETFRDSAEQRVSVIRESVAENSERLEEWRADVTAQLASLRSQLNRYSERRGGEPIGARVRQRLIDSSTSMKNRAEKKLEELERKWNEYNKKS